MQGNEWCVVLYRAVYSNGEMALSSMPGFWVSIRLLLLIFFLECLPYFVKSKVGPLGCLLWGVVNVVVVMSVERAVKRAV